MAAGIEREVKIRFADAPAARAAVLATGANRFRPRRLQQDFLLDTPEGYLRSRQSVLRVHSEGGSAVLTFKGPVQPGSMKIREEIETQAGAPAALLEILTRAGFHVWFRYQKYREEFTWDEVIVALDETPLGVFVELEGDERAVIDCAGAIGRGPGDFILDSYRGLFLQHCEQRGLAGGDMLFERG